MINKKEFTKIIKRLVTLKKDEDNLNKAFKRFEPDFNYINFGRYEELITDTLKKAMNDESDWIGYWLYELDCGTKARIGSVKKDGKYIPIKTISNLYDCIKNV